jgi:hypothetical protein
VNSGRRHATKDIGRRFCSLVSASVLPSGRITVLDTMLRPRNVPLKLFTSTKRSTTAVNSLTLLLRCERKEDECTQYGGLVRGQRCLVFLFFLFWLASSLRFLVQYSHTIHPLQNYVLYIELPRARKEQFFQHDTAKQHYTHYTRSDQLMNSSP